MAFSTMQLDAAKLAGKNHGVLAASYLLLSVAVGTLTAGLGMAHTLAVHRAEEALSRPNSS